MGALPKRKISLSRSKKRTNSKKLKLINGVVCSKCKQYKLSHRPCTCSVIAKD